MKFGSSETETILPSTKLPKVLARFWYNLNVYDKLSFTSSEHGSELVFHIMCQIKFYITTRLAHLGTDCTQSKPVVTEGLNFFERLLIQ